MSELIRAIETAYSGYRFRSRLEARWAVFFDTAGIRWEYEKEGYDLSGIAPDYDPDDNRSPLPEGSLYLPDFWLPDIGLRYNTSPGLWFEVKGKSPTEKETDFCIALGHATGQPCAIGFGMPGCNDMESGINQIYPWWDNYMHFFKCYNPKCGYIKLEFGEGSYMYCPKCNKQSDDEHESLALAILSAKQARFEHGENSRTRRVFQRRRG